jgi:hypothetical protein
MIISHFFWNWLFLHSLNAKIFACLTRLSGGWLFHWVEVYHCPCTCVIVACDSSSGEGKLKWEVEKNSLGLIIIQLTLQHVIDNLNLKVHHMSETPPKYWQTLGESYVHREQSCRKSFVNRTTPYIKVAQPG